MKSGSQRDISTPMFTAALVTITKMWKQLKCPSGDGWGNNAVYTYNGVLFSLKKNKGPQYNNILTNAR